MRAAWYRARREVRRRWRAIAALALIVGVAGGAVLALVAGARRSASSYDRFRTATLASDLDVRRDGPPSGDDVELQRAIAALPQVVAVTRNAYPFVVPAGSGLYPYLDFLAWAPLDRESGTNVDRPRVREGRLPRADRADEMAVFRVYAREANLHVGQRVSFDSYAPDQMEPLFTGGGDAVGAPRGPRTTLTVTGVLDAPTFVSESVGDFVPRMMLTYAFARDHASDIATYPNGFTLRLRNGSRDVPAVTAALRARFRDDPTLEMQPTTEVDGKIRSSIDVIVVALVLCAIGAGVAGLLAVGQTLGRHFAAGGVESQQLVALGMTRRERLATLAATAVPISLGGAATSVAVAFLVSPWLPVGVARRAEPHPGFAFDAWVCGAGALAVVLVVLVAGVGAAWSVIARQSGGRRSRARHAPLPVRALGRLRLSPAASIGVGLAFEPRDGTATAVRSGLSGLVVGATGVVAIAVFVASLATTVATPARYGSPWDAIIPGFSADSDQVGRALRSDRDADRVAILSSALARVRGVEANVHAVEPVKGSVSPTVLDGRMPYTRNEVALGAKTMRDLGLHVDDTVAITGNGNAVDARVVGTVALPVIDERSSVGRGAWLTPRDIGRIADGEQLNRDVVVGWAPGVDKAARNRVLAARTGAKVLEPMLPSDVNNLHEVRSLLRALAGFVAFLALLASIHAFAATVRLRRRELAVLRSLGFERRQLGATVAWQATALAATGVIVGVPLGVVAGRLAWRNVAHTIGVVSRPDVPPLLVVVVAIAVFAVANVAAAMPARAARRAAPARVLRTG